MYAALKEHLIAHKRSYMPLFIGSLFATAAVLWAQAGILSHLLLGSAY